MEMVELLVRMDCSGCERKVRKQLSKIKGVDSVEVDLTSSKVTVMGYVDRKKVLKAVRKAGNRAEFWPDSYKSYGGSSNYPYMMQMQAFRSTYNYEKHGYNEYKNFEENPSSSDAQISSMFSDENANACSIM